MLRPVPSYEKRTAINLVFLAKLPNVSYQPRDLLLAQLSVEWGHLVLSLCHYFRELRIRLTLHRLG